jgi:CubicO group peptidase (beta-lactamase class C family)
MKDMFDTARPEEVGIRPGHIADFLERLDEGGIPMHSVLIMRHGKLVAEAYYAPYRADMPHRMFSVTKSFVSVAIGLLVQEGRIGLDDRIVDYFPDKQPVGGADELMARTTIRHMLKMQSPHSVTTYRIMKDDDWTGTFFKVHPDHLPGTVYNYDTSSTHTLCALVERITGMGLLEYLRGKCLDRIGFSRMAYALKDPTGVTQGGTGLVCTPRDLLAFIKLVADGGRHDGEQLLPEDYVREMTRWQVDNSDRAATLEEGQGYGYQFWRTRNNGYCCYGMGGQYGMVFPDKDIILVTTADTQRIKGGNQVIFNAFYETVYDRLDGTGGVLLPDAAGYERLAGCLSSRRLAVVGAGCPDRNLGVSIEGHNDNCFTGIKIYDCGGNAPKPDMGAGEDLQDRRLSGLVRLELGGKPRCFGYVRGEGILQAMPGYGYQCAVTAGWITETDFVMKVQLLDECVGSIVLRVTVDGDMATVMLNKCEETMFSEYNGFYYGRIIE